MSVLFYLPLFFFVGPMTGALLRGFQSCCLEFSVNTALVLSPVLVVAYAARLLPWFDHHRRLRAVIWWVGCIAWVLGAPFSCLHALS